MAAFPCPYCAHALVSDADADADAKLERCPSCAGTLLIAYRYRLVAAHGTISGGLLYEAVDDGFNQRVAVLFVEDQDPAAAERFIEGSRLFADLGGRGLVKIHEVGTSSDRRPYVVMDWLEGSTLDRVVERRGALEQAVLLALVGDLLTGLGKAHRSMPVIVHGHIHPGKIGFRSGSSGDYEAVLFGFEWAKQVSAQASRLADSYLSEREDDERGPAEDLRQLGVAIHYAATGEWLGDRPLAHQRERARAQVPGPLGRLIDRLLGAGSDGYQSAVEAAIDFEQLMRGVDRFQAPAPLRVDRSDERMGTAWADADADAELEELEDLRPIQPIAESPSQPTSSPPPAAAAEPNWAAWAAQRQAEALARQQAQVQAQAKPNAGRAVVIFMGIAVAFTTCVGAIIADSDEFASDPAPQPPSRVEPIPAEPLRPEPIPSLPPLPEPAPATSLAGTFHYEGKITGPPTFAGLELGEACEVWVTPNSGDLNCRWMIDCGTPRRRIYGGGDVGFSTCKIGDAGQPLGAEDDQDEVYDGAFLADLESSEPMIVVLDRWTLPPVHVIIGIETGGPSDEQPPELPQAPRVERGEIERRIAADDFPIVEPGVLGDW